METSDEKDYVERKKVFYSAMISAWLNTKLERDKQLLALSSTAIGLLVTLLKIIGIADVYQLWLYILSLLSFLVTIISVVYILGENSSHIENILNGVKIKSRRLSVADKVAATSFVTGVILVITIGISSASISLGKGDIDMSQEQCKNSTSQQDGTRSWNGVEQLRPKPPKSQTGSAGEGSKAGNTSDSSANSSSSNDGNSK